MSLKEPNPDNYIWKYLDDSQNYIKLKTFLNKALYFSSIHSFEDYYESIKPVHFYNDQFFNYATLLMRAGYHENLANKLLQDSLAQPFHYEKFDHFKNLCEKEFTSHGVEIKDKDKVDAFRSLLSREHQDNKRKQFMSCWFTSESETESYLMWKTYSSPNGIAIRMKYKDFKNLILNKLKKNHFSYGLVEYIDFNDEIKWNEKIENKIPLNFLKHSSYESEREFRITFSDETINTTSGIAVKFNSVIKGYEIDLILSPSLAHSFFHIFYFENFINNPEMTCKLLFSNLFTLSHKDKDWEKINQIFKK